MPLLRRIVRISVMSLVKRHMNGIRLYFRYYTVNLAESHFCELLFYGSCRFDAARLSLFCGATEGLPANN